MHARLPFCRNFRMFIAIHLARFAKCGKGTFLGGAEATSIMAEKSSKNGRSMLGSLIAPFTRGRTHYLHEVKVRRFIFVLHFAVFILAAALASYFVAFTRFGASILGPIFLIWTTILALHLIYAYGPVPRLRDRREESEVERFLDET